MEIITLGSSSKGNGYVIDRTLVIEAGVPIKELKKTLNFNLSGIQAVLISHSHGDHSKYASEYLKAGIDCYMSKHTKSELNLQNFTNRIKIIEHQKVFIIGDYTILPFELSHDVMNFGYLIYNRKTKEKLLFATDTYSINYNFKDVNYYMIEANYSEKIIRENIKKGLLAESLAKRLYHSHFSLENCIDFLRCQDLSKCMKIILIHLSDGNSNEKMFVQEIKKEFMIDTEAADKYKGFKLSIEPF